jgi:MerR family transcriptional regulator, thiopeptide resistance regulator
MTAIENEYAQEAEQRWGDTEQYRQSMERTSRYTEADWQRIKAEAAAVEQDLAAAMADGVPADSDRAADLAEAHRQHISQYYYECGYDIHRGLGEMYVTDPRFTAHYELVADGLATYVRDAIQANAARHDTA